MTFLPIAGRELRVASRKGSTFWVRIAAALVALAIASGFLLLTQFAGFGFGTASLGKGLFSTLTWLSLAAALSAGLFFTSDCLSEEKREGTMGFLFLTDLKGYDVVLGKLLATSLRGFYALLAIFPILALTLLMGGMTGAEFWKTALALVNAMFISLAAGMIVSSMSRDSQQALAATLFLLLLLSAGGPLGDAIIAAMNKRSFRPVLSLSSPVFLFVNAGRWGQNPFWLALLVNQIVSWLFLALACFLLPRTWQEKAAKISMVRKNWMHWWKFGGAKRQAALRRKLVSVNPVLWLACRERWQAGGLWVLSLLMAATAVIILVIIRKSQLWFFWTYLSGAVTLALYLGVTSQACRFFVEAQRSGLIELLLVTPLTAKQVVQGQWRALLRMFGPPLAIYLATQLIGAVMYQQLWNSMVSTIPAPPPAPTMTTNTNSMIMTTASTVTITTTTGGVTTTVSGSGLNPPAGLIALAGSIAGILTVAANLTALIWFGMWMGLTSKTTNLATLKTIVFVQIIPWFVGTFASMMSLPLFFLPGLFGGGMAAQMMVWYPLIMTGVTTLLFVGKDVGFFLWARKKLYSKFREQVTRTVAPIRLPQLPPLPANKG